MQMQPDFEKANEIYFRLGIIYKQQQKYNQSLEVRSNPPPPQWMLVMTLYTDIQLVLQIHR